MSNKPTTDQMVKVKAITEHLNAACELYDQLPDEVKHYGGLFPNWGRIAGGRTLGYWLAYTRTASKRFYKACKEVFEMKVED